MRLSRHFTLSEMCATLTGLENSPGLHEIVNLTRLCCQVLEPLRALDLGGYEGTPHETGGLRINSGFRSPAVNTAIGGARQSTHMRGLAADVKPYDRRVPVSVLMRALVASSVPFDKVIYERRGDAEWLHVQVEPAHAAPRRRALQSLSAGSFEPWEHP